MSQKSLAKSSIDSYTIDETQTKSPLIQKPDESAIASDLNLTDLRPKNFQQPETMSKSFITNKDSIREDLISEAFNTQGRQPMAQPIVESNDFDRIDVSVSPMPLKVNPKIDGGPAFTVIDQRFMASEKSKAEGGDFGDSELGVVKDGTQGEYTEDYSSLVDATALQKTLS